MAKPKAFEVEDISTRKNFTFVYEPNSKQVHTYDTSIRKPRKLLSTHREHKGELIPTYAYGNHELNVNPLDKNKAKEYFESLFQKSLKIIDNICFLGWVNPDTFQPLEEEQEEERSKNMEYIFEKNKLYAHLGDSLVKELKKHKCFVAGGTITSLFCNREFNDIDIYFRSEAALIEFIEDNWSDGWVVANTNKATLLRYDNCKEVQLIHFDYFKSSQEIFDTFDFTVCMGSFDFADEQFYLHEEFLRHNSQRTLRFNKHTSFPVVSLLRVQKYKDKGYYISKPELIRITMACMNLNISTLDELKDHLGGMYGINYDKAFEGTETGGFSLDAAIDKIENLSLDEDYFKAPKEQEFDNMDSFIDDIRKMPVKYFIHNDNVYRIRVNGTLRDSDDEPKNGIKVAAENHLKDRKLYKFVEKKDGKYFSFYKNSFEYKFGEKVVPIKVNSYIGREYPVLYFSELKEVNTSTYRNYDNSALIEVEFDIEDFDEKDGDQVLLKACKVIREVPKEEYEQYL